MVVVGAVVDAPHIMELVVVAVESVMPEENDKHECSKFIMFQKDHKLELVMAFVIACTSKPSNIYQIEYVSHMHCTALKKYALQQGNMPILEPRYLQG